MESFGGDVMTIAEYRKHIECGCFVPYDGSGYYCKQIDGKIEESTKAADFTLSLIDKVICEGIYTHVAWYNK